MRTVHARISTSPTVTTQDIHSPAAKREKTRDKIVMYITEVMNYEKVRVCFIVRGDDCEGGSGDE